MNVTADLDARVWITAWPSPLGALPSPDWLRELGRVDALSPWAPPGEPERTAVRDLLRAGGFSPSGRNKPCCEYIRAAAEKGQFPWISGPVDAVNALALHAAIPAGILDADRLTAPLRFAVGERGQTYVFNRAGQTLDLGGLLLVADANGPCSTPVKDPMHAKTTDDTVRTLTVIWGTTRLPGRAEAASAWLVELFGRLGGVSTPVAVRGAEIGPTDGAA